MSKDPRKAFLNKSKERVESGSKDRPKTRFGVIDHSKLREEEFTDEDYYQIKQGKKNKNRINIMPWVVTQKWYKDLMDPTGTKSGIEVGQWDYKLEYPIHRGIGPNRQDLLCLKAAFGKKCKVCEERQVEFAKKKEDRDQKFIQSTNISWRSLFNVREEGSKKTLLFPISRAMFSAQLEKDAAEEGKLTFADPEDGCLLVFTGKKKEFDGNSFTEVPEVDFEERDKQFNISVVDKSYSLDAGLIIPTYEEGKELFEGSAGEEEEDEDEDDKPKRKKSSKDEDEDEDEDEKDEEEEEDEKPRRTTKKNSKKDEEEEEEEEEDDCPFDYTIGKDHSKKPKCEKCEDKHGKIFDTCYNLYRKKYRK